MSAANISYKRLGNRLAREEVKSVNPSIFDLSGKVAVVTGGYQGIGYGIAEGLAQAGADIVVGARNLDRCREACSELGRLGVKALPVKCDVSKTADADNLIQVTVKEFGKIDILVNNAGITGGAKPAVEMSDEEFDKTIAVDLRGVFLCSRAAAREMIKQNRGKIINIASILSHDMVWSNSADYCAAKGGVLQLTKAMALELARYNIQVNVINPGYFVTPHSEAYWSGLGEQRVKAIPLRRLGQGNDIKGAAVFLASSASDYLIGSAIDVDGGVLIR